MSPLLPIFWVVITLLWVGAALLATQAYRASENVSLRFLSATAASMALTYTTVVIAPADSPFFKTFFIYFIGLMTSYLQIGLFRSLLRTSRLGPAMLGELAIAVPLAVVTAVAWFTAPKALLPIFVQSGAAADSHAFAFNVAAVTYFTYVSIRTIVWTSQIVPQIRQSRALQTGLGLIGFGSIAHTIAGFGNLYASLQGFGAPLPQPGANIFAILPIFTTIGFSGLIIGVLIPMISTMVQEIPDLRLQAARRRALRPLSKALREAFPEVTLKVSGRQSRYYRTVVEIRDGLVLLSPYTDPAVAHRVTSVAREQGESEESSLLTAQAAVLAAALAARGEDRRPDQNLPPLTGPADTAPDWEGEAAWQVKLSERFATSGNPPGAHP